MDIYLFAANKALLLLCRAMIDTIQRLGLDREHNWADIKVHRPSSCFIKRTASQATAEESISRRCDGGALPFCGYSHRTRDVNDASASSRRTLVFEKRYTPERKLHLCYKTPPRIDNSHEKLL